MFPQMHKYSIVNNQKITHLKEANWNVHGNFWGCTTLSQIYCGKNLYTAFHRKCCSVRVRVRVHVRVREGMRVHEDLYMYWYTVIAPS